MKVLKFKIVGRVASLVSDKYLAEAKEAFSFSAPGARYTYAFKQWAQQKALGIPEDERQGWDGKTSLMKNGTIPVGLLLGVADELAKDGYDIRIEEWKNKPHVELTKGFRQTDPKYFYQNEATDAMILSVDKGGGLVLAATGSGKTATFAQFASWVSCRILFVVDQIPLLYQSQKEIQDWLSKEGYDAKVGVVGNGKFDPARITVATIQTLQKRRGRSEFRKWIKDIEIVVIDELHAQMSRRNFSVIDLVKPQAVIGLTATMQLSKKPVRFKCYAIAGPKVFDFPIEKATEAGVVSPGIVIQVPVADNIDFHRLVKNAKGKQVAVDPYTHQVVDNENANNLICRLVKECRARDLCVVVLVHRIYHLKYLAKRLDKYDPKLFYGEVSKDDRRKQLKLFDKGREDLILANQVFTKGINLKRIDVVIDGAQQSSKNDCLQKYGRAARLHAEKAGIFYFDITTISKATEKAGKSRKAAFKKAKIPIETVAPNLPVKEIMAAADKLLSATLKSKKLAQGKLFT